MKNKKKENKRSKKNREKCVCIVRFLVETNFVVLSLEVIVIYKNKIKRKRKNEKVFGFE
jgi:hypothetical protein